MLFLFKSSTFAAELITTFTGSSVIERYGLTNGNKFSSYTRNDTWTDNFGNYVTWKCIGTIKTYKSKIALDIMCENRGQNKNKN